LLQRSIALLLLSTLLCKKRKQRRPFGIFDLILTLQKWIKAHENLRFFFYLILWISAPSFPFLLDAPFFTLQPLLHSGSFASANPMRSVCKEQLEEEHQSKEEKEWRSGAPILDCEQSSTITKQKQKFQKQMLSVLVPIFKAQGRKINILLILI
jgi:hypothetical protein